MNRNHAGFTCNGLVTDNGAPIQPQGQTHCGRFQNQSAGPVSAPNPELPVASARGEQPRLTIRSKHPMSSAVMVTVLR